MLKLFRQWVGRNWIGTVVCLTLGCGLFAIGYWSGQRAQPPAKSSQAVSLPQTTSKGGAPATLRTTDAANATPEMKEFMQNREILAEKMQQFRAQPSNGNGNPKALAEFQKENADLLKRQSQLAQILAQQQSKNPVPMPPPLQIPPNASPQLKTFLVARDQLMRDQIAFQNQHLHDDPAVQQAAMKQWRQQNAVRFQQLQQDAQQLAQGNAAAHSGA